MVPVLRGKAEGGCLFIKMSILKRTNSNDFLRDDLSSESFRKLNIVLVGEDGVGKEYYAREIHKLNKSKHDFSLIDFETDCINRKKIVDSLITQDNENFRKEAQENSIFLRRFDLIEGYLLQQIQDFLRKVGFSNTHQKEHLLELRILCSVDEVPDRLKNRKLQDILDEFFVVEVRIPPLRERMPEFYELVASMARDYDQVFRENLLQVISSTYERLSQYTWPGNLNELQSLLDGMFLLVSHDEATINKYFSQKFDIRTGAHNNQRPKILTKIKKEYQNYA